MQKLGINKANMILSWITVVMLVIGIISFMYLVYVMFDSLDITNLTDASKMEQATLDLETKFLEDESSVGSLIISSLLVGVSTLFIIGLSIAGIIVSIISLVKCKEYKLNKSGSILTLVGYGIILIFNVTLVSLASIVLLIIGAIKLKDVTSVSYEELEKLKVLKSEN